MPKDEPSMKLYLLDTSVILDDPLNILRLYDNDTNVVAITDIVLSELNRHKDDMMSEAGYQAREFFRIADNEDGRSIGLKELPVEIQDAHKNSKLNGDDGFYKMVLHYENSYMVQRGIATQIPLYIIYRKHYKSSVGHETRNIANDIRIGEIATDYNFKLMSNDISFKIAANVSGIEAESMFHNRSENPLMLEFSKIIFRQKGEKLENSTTLEKVKNFEQLTIKEMKHDEDGLEYESGVLEYGIYFNNRVEIENFDERFNSNFKGHVRPINVEQKFFYTLLTHPQNMVTVVSGSTGSGKTLIALQAGIELVREGVVEGIVYARNTITSVDKQAELGYRKGDQTQKLNYFMYPLYSAINFTIEQMQKRSVEAKLNLAGNTSSMEKENITERFMLEHSIEVIDMAHLRGTTISRKFVIIDEAQNLSNSTMKLLGTRMGEGTRLSILGDTQQIDHPYLSRRRNALVSMLQLAKKDNFIAGIQLRHTIRSQVADWFDKNL